MRIVITGNSTGIGKMLSDRLEQRGHTVIGLSRTGPLQCDVTDYEQVEDWARYVLDTYDGVDGLITCAGTQGELGKTSRTSPEKWAHTVRVNLDGTYNAIRAFHPMMDQVARPKIICFAGGGGGEGRAFFSAYASAKAAVARLVETFALEEPSTDINAIAPGAINTNIIKGALEAGPGIIGQCEYDKAVKQSNHGDDPAPMLELVDWLLSPKSDGISGRFISAKWDDWKTLVPSVLPTDAFKLRRTFI